MTEQPLRDVTIAAIKEAIVAPKMLALGFDADDARQLVPHLADALAAAGLLRAAPGSPADVVEQVRDLVGAVEPLVEAARVDPDLLRWCQWPGCLCSFHVVTGPRPAVEGRGWVYVRGTGTPVLLCPDHAPAGHNPGHRDWTPGDDTLTATCQCGTEQVVQPTNQHAVMAWWRTHIENLEAQRG